ncbi:histidine kinase dimerization/phosphoacceptor domain -containing protein [Sphingomonas sp. Leaf343]|uniref:histidine kinase dimerization/phosphoacceptor domain -containing protein n=1 Tax=Sphingomonas sp. Leaf343 TaxID=1736345 RepID=UPI0006FB0F28|nr:histidine kinase dimerization/phosphoacceptor domain -containing protein [Sphingomonas sp. Leaf343]KQR82165.1 histidine kinase [Sphingomonas sp. Leaf343]
MNQRDDWHLTEALDYEHGRADPFAAAVRATRMPMVITDPSEPDNPIVFCNEAFQKLTGYDRDEIIGRNCRFLQGPDTSRDDVARVRTAVAAQADIAVDLLNYRKDGSTFWNALYLSPVRNDAGDVVFFFASQLDVTERVQAQITIAGEKTAVEREVEARTADLKAALEAKTLLLHEVDHRVKNNLTMIGSLLRLQARSIADPAITSKLETMLERVDALATVHRRLYQSEDVTRFDLGAFVENLVSDVVGASGRTDIAIETDVTPIEVPSSKAAALGLILNEITTNAIKHAFVDGRAGTITIRASLQGCDAVVEISDDGHGLASEQARPDGMGKTLIARLARQVTADVRWSDAVPGARVTVSFPVTD